MFCNHKWNIVSEYQFENELKKLCGSSLDGFTAKELAKRGVITVVQCEKCTTVKHIKTIF